MAQGAEILSIESDEITQLDRIERYDGRLLKAAYRYCQSLTKNHYENFPVASLILPLSIRPAIAAIYAFSRLADDFADEPGYAGERLKRLDEWQMFLTEQNHPTHPVFIALKDTIQKHDLPQHLLLDLLTAFKMDVQKKRYHSFKEVTHYCGYSANPVGRLVLHLFGHYEPRELEWSDDICTALQLANFWQDVAIDLEKDRIYLPQDEMQSFGVSEDDLSDHVFDNHFKDLMEFQVERTRQIFLKGKDLGNVLAGRLGVEIRLTWLAGMSVLKQLAAVEYDVFLKRPKLEKMDFVRLLPIALSQKRFEKFT